MHKHLAAIKSEFEAFDHEQHDTAHFNKARQIADDHVTSNPDAFTDFTGEKPGQLIADLKQAMQILGPEFEANPNHHAIAASAHLATALLAGGPLSLVDCVKAVDVFRAAGMDEAQYRVEAWLLHRFEPQNIGADGTAPTPRLRDHGATFHVVDGRAVRQPATNGK